MTNLQLLTSTNRSVYFQRLLQLCQQFSPYLQSVMLPAGSGMIKPHDCNQRQIEKLYSELQQCSPEAGSGYWLSRSWTLLCWQPIYIAMISIYQTKALAPLNRIEQHRESAMVAGFKLSDNRVLAGEEEWLIAYAGEQLAMLFDHYFADFSALYQRKERWKQRFISDAVLSSLLHIKQNNNESNGELLQHAQWWLRAVQLPAQGVQSLQPSDDGKQLKLTRQSCCLVFKVAGAQLCQACPCRHRGKINNTLSGCD